MTLCPRCNTNPRLPDGVFCKECRALDRVASISRGCLKRVAILLFVLCALRYLGVL